MDVTNMSTSEYTHEGILFKHNFQRCEAGKLHTVDEEFCTLPFVVEVEAMIVGSIRVDVHHERGDESETEENDVGEQENGAFLKPLLVHQ